MQGMPPTCRRPLQRISQEAVTRPCRAPDLSILVHSAYSLLKGSIKIAKLAELAKKDHQPALALTDTTICSVRSNSPTRWRVPASSRS